METFLDILKSVHSQQVFSPEAEEARDLIYKENRIDRGSVNYSV